MGIANGDIYVCYIRTTHGKKTNKSHFSNCSITRALISAFVKHAKNFQDPISQKVINPIAFHIEKIKTMAQLETVECQLFLVKLANSHFITPEGNIGKRFFYTTVEKETTVPSAE